MLSEHLLNLIFLLVPVGSAFALIFAYFLYRWVSKQDPGTPKMQEIGRAHV